METNILEVRGLQAGYGNVQAVRDIGLSVASGRIVTVIGPNGAGKSTLLSSLMGALPHNGNTSGEVRYLGRDISSLPIVERVRMGICLVPEKRALFSSMSVEDNLQLGAYSRKKNGERNYMDQLDFIYGLFARLKERRKQQAATLSGGERQMLAIGRGLMGKPRLLMLDEPSLGLAPRIVMEIFEAISNLKEAGMGVVLVEQNARAALKISDYGYVLETGNIVLHGPSERLANDPKVVDSYLGMGGQE